MDAGDFEILKRTRLFNTIDDDTLRTLLHGVLPRSYGKGQVIFQHGEPADAFYVVLDGWVKVFRASPAGEEAVFGIFTVGETFAEAALFLADPDAFVTGQNLQVNGGATLMRIPTGRELAG